MDSVFRVIRRSDRRWPIEDARSRSVQPEQDGWVIAIIVGNRAKAYPVTSLPRSGVISDLVGGQEVRLSYDPASRQPSAFLADTGKTVPYVMVYWFAWQANSDGHHDDAESNAAALKRVREKIVRTVKARGINYTILLDEHNAVGGRFNGGELPTTVIVDAEGNVRRRFVGARSLPVFEAMIAEATRPLAGVGR